MTRDEIYDHLAQVYLGKRNDIDKTKKKKHLNSWLVINIVITGIIFSSAIYGLTAFLTHRGDVLQNRVIYTLNNGPVRLSYNLNAPYPSVKTFSLSVPDVNVTKYSNLQFTVRGLEEGWPGTMRVEIKNHKNETSFVYLEGIQQKWKTFEIPFAEFGAITDWSDISEIGFVLEAWNAEKKKGKILIDNICFSS